MPKSADKSRENVCPKCGSAEAALAASEVSHKRLVETLRRARQMLGQRSLHSDAEGFAIIDAALAAEAQEGEDKAMKGNICRHRIDSPLLAERIDALAAERDFAYDLVQRREIGTLARMYEVSAAERDALRAKLPKVEQQSINARAVRAQWDAALVNIKTLETKLAASEASRKRLVKALRAWDKCRCDACPQCSDALIDCLAEAQKGRTKP